MYKGWIKCSLDFQKLIGFQYEGKHKRRENYYKFFDCEVTDGQYRKMNINWEKFKEDIQWYVRKKVNIAYGIHEGDITASILSGKQYFFNSYKDIYHESRLEEWTEDNGMYVTSRDKYVDERYNVTKGHIRSDGSLFDEHRSTVWKDDAGHQFKEEDIDTYIEDLKIIKSKLQQLL